MDYTFLQNKINKIYSINAVGAIKLLLLITTFFVSSLFAQNGEVKFEMSASKYLMGTLFEITAVHTSIDSGKRAMYFALREVERIEKVMSNYKDSSEISYVNKNAYSHPVKVDSELFGILSRSMEYSKMFDGYFDITVAPLTNYWGFNSDHPIKTEPDRKRIVSLLEFVNYKYVRLDYTDSTVTFTKSGVEIDLGGIAKGYALDRAIEVMKKFGVDDFLISGGGDLYASGKKADGKKWTVGIKDPRSSDALLEVFEVENTGILTSGDYERFEIINGKRYHHIFNPKTGYPSEESQSATVIIDNCEYGVVISKMLFITGERFEVLKNLPFYRVTGDGKKNVSNEMKKIVNSTKK